ncbi:MAG: 3-hydroxyacyl-CoA dehydrogenase NAD-binding domain-containing protein [Syntrophomonas sp.]|uniref:3-hydroxyacyl-CoA dehydrogenase family protein n=1 Tax=Syntrophomonas sp. TaxID=2053627 RepID=UPI002607BA0C|nr:3-hydroxyacyl-CoA dehydrogenase NAD-binding domain-containing protein [Syntrophomonas sp.]MDD2509787.1 3-hydroxyacyl-CoA dehydrogenase NAD-binding domain-containing protein [Syntrophomonas sp.]MDD3878895.1 3-hydroxyacyl-CoA dehydrogenase NAD-binding domain-containing protein [Syntrophomonas sp.]MDD4625720.1 3-hydroxyacyl-CoA dehydrogenase NAD-binding domain-containing protein [Syntrophomonas sp.]
MKKIAVLGAGIMGAGIAQVLAQGGHTVIMRDLQMTLVKDGLQTIEKNLEKGIAKGILLKEQKKIIMSRIHGSTDLADLHDVDLVIEAVVENMAIKKQIFAELDNLCSYHTILATNTSSLSIAEIASSTRRRDRIVGLHFFNPVPMVKLVEVIKGIDTSPETLEIARDFVQNLGKHPVLVNMESPGFVVNRILIPYLNEAIWVYGEGIAEKEEIDLAMKLGAGMPRGPLELADSIGLDLLFDSLQVFYEEFRDSKYRPHILLSTLVRAGYWGKKSGRGFYNYRD